MKVMFNCRSVSSSGWLLLLSINVWKPQGFKMVLSVMYLFYFGLPLEHMNSEVM